MKRILIFLCTLMFAFIVSAGSIPSTTGIVAEDISGNTWDFDALLQAGKHIVIHQIWSG